VFYRKWSQQNKIEKKESLKFTSECRHKREWRWSIDCRPRTCGSRGCKWMDKGL